MTTYMSRSAWTTAPRGGAALTGSQLVGIAVHWPGSSTLEYGVESAAEVAARLRGWRDFHVNGRGWSDIGYNVGIDQSGRVWDLRGIGRVGAHAASASNPDANHEWFGVLLILGAQEQPSQAMIAAFRHFRYTVFFERYGSDENAIRGHGQVPGAQTSCPGSRVLALIGDGTLEQPPGTEEEEMSEKAERQIEAIYKVLCNSNDDMMKSPAGNRVSVRYGVQEADRFINRYRATWWGNWEERWPALKEDFPDGLTMEALAVHSYGFSRFAIEKLDHIIHLERVQIDAFEGQDTKAILSRIDKRARETRELLGPLQDKLDFVADLVQRHHDGELDAEQALSKVAERLAPPAVSESGVTEE